MRSHRALPSGSTTVLTILFILGHLNLVTAQRRPTDFVSPEILPDHSVIFRLRAPDASQVLISGTWSPDYMRQVEMVMKDSLWEARVGRIAADAYEHEYIIDGIPNLDPNTRLVTRDGAWIQNMIIIPGEGSWVYEANDVPHRTVHAIWYDSPTIGETRGMQIYLPPRL